MQAGDRTTVLLDLDGTLVDPAQGIIGCCRFALAALGQRVPAPEELEWVIGPPLRDSFARLLGDDGDPELAVQLYRRRYSEAGLFEARVYEGIPEALVALRGRVTRLLLCTSKPTVFAERVVEHFGLREHLAGVYGADLDGRFDDKGDLIAHLLDAERLSPDDAVMVGDRKHDVIAASRHGIPTIGALWGYGGEHELTQAGVSILASAPADLTPAFVSLAVRATARTEPTANNDRPDPMAPVAQEELSARDFARR